MHVVRAPRAVLPLVLLHLLAHRSDAPRAVLLLRRTRGEQSRVRRAIRRAVRPLVPRLRLPLLVIVLRMGLEWEVNRDKIEIKQGLLAGPARHHPANGVGVGSK